MSAAAIIEMVNHSDLLAKRFLKQELIPLDPFLQSSNGSLYEAARGGAA